MGQSIETNTTIREEIGKRIKNTSPLKLYNILRDLTDDIKYINIFKSYVINETNFDDERFYSEHQVDSSDWWDSISYEYYETDNLWWMIAMTNYVVNPFEGLEEGTSLKILKPDYVYKLLKEVEKVGSS